MKLVEYTEEVLNYLEYIGYQDIVKGFAYEDVAQSVAKTAMLFCELDQSVRMCALVIFGHTWKYQVMRVEPNSTIN